MFSNGKYSYLVVLAMLCAGLINGITLTLPACAEDLMAETPVQEPGSVIQFSKNSALQEFTVNTDKAYEIQVRFYAADVFRILAAPNGQFEDPLNDPNKVSIVIHATPEVPEVVVQETSDQIEFATDRLTLRLHRKVCQFELLDARQEVIWKELKPLQFGETTTQTLSTGLDEFYYGGGQQNGSFSHKGTN